MKKIAWYLLIIFVLGWTSCSTISVVVDFDETVDFAQYRSFAFVRPRQQAQVGGGRIRNPLFNQDVMREIKPVLESKGLTEATSRERADLLVVFYAAVQNRRDWVPPTYRVGRWGRVWSTRPGHFQRVKEGTLVIDMVDNRKKELVWQGVGQGVLDRSNPGQNLVDSASNILQRFPPEE